MTGVRKSMARSYTYILKQFKSMVVQVKSLRRSATRRCKGSQRWSAPLAHSREGSLSARPKQRTTKSKILRWSRIASVSSSPPTKNQNLDSPERSAGGLDSGVQHEQPFKERHSRTITLDAIYLSWRTPDLWYSAYGCYFLWSLLSSPCATVTLHCSWWVLVFSKPCTSRC